MRKTAILFVCLAAITLGLMPLSIQGQRGAGGVLSEPPAVPGEFLVQFREGATAGEKSRALARADAQVLDDVLSERGRKDRRGDLVLVRHRPDFTPAAARRALESDPAIEFAEPNWILTQTASSNDPYYTNGSLWNMFGNATSPVNAFGSQAGEAWAAGYTGSSNVYVGIIDGGVMFNHEDLAGQIWTNAIDTPNGVDDDNNGYVDDIHGWDFLSNDNSIYDSGDEDHGTHVAGILGAKGGNGKGVAGINWNIRIIVGKFIKGNGTVANAIKAVDYMTDLKTRQGLNIVATSNSWGSYGFSQALLDAIERANSANILFIAAAGNGGADSIGDDNDTAPFYPASYPGMNIISVASINSVGDKAPSSNYGASAVDIGAPGVNIYSAIPGKGAKGTYGALNGTSMATPHVTGAAALLASRYGGISAADIKTLILSTAVPTPALAGRTVTGGRLNIAAALGVDR